MISGWLNVFGGRLIKGSTIGLLGLVFGFMGWYSTSWGSVRLNGVVFDLMGQLST